MTQIIDKFKLVYCDLNFNLDIKKTTLLALDRNLISQVIQNLIDNAIEANPIIKLHITLTGRIQNDQFILNVFNNGSELTDLSSIFKPHFTTKSDKKNSGLGLTICKSTMIKHGGDLVAIDAQNGACFELNFPTRIL
jgi:signal transduction histidine kinase